MLTLEEDNILHHLKCAYEVFRRLPDKHPSDMPEFVLSVHRLQNLVAFRVARRVDPDTWWAPNQDK
jgi:hypothetical protein